MGVLDQTGDAAGVEIYRVAALYAAPDFVKAAAAADLCGGPEVPAHCYADPLRRAWPVHTPAATWVSLALFEEKRATLDARTVARAEAALDKAARHWGIAGDARRLRAAVKEA